MSDLYDLYGGYESPTKRTPRYIDAELIKYHPQQFFGSPYGGNKYDIVTRSEVEKIPTADVTEIKHGKWIMVKDDGYNAIYECSLCGRKIGCDRYPTKRVVGIDYPIAVSVEELFPYCHCGAKMNKEVDK